MQQHNQQYSTGSSGAQGMTLASSSRAVRGTVNYQAAMHGNMEEFEEAKHGHRYGNNELYTSGTGTGGAAGEAGSSNKTAQRRNRRGYRQQNQQPSSGANDREHNRRHNRNRNNRQGRQTSDS